MQMEMVGLTAENNRPTQIAMSVRSWATASSKPCLMAISFSILTIAELMLWRARL